MPTQRTGLVTLKGNPQTLVGNDLTVGDTAPDFTLTANDLSSKSLSDFSGKVKIIAAVPSLDTGVCDTEMRRFNKDAAELSNDIVLLTVSVDTPFAQKRWCGSAEAGNLVSLSDFKDHSFGEAYGVRMKEAGLLARTVFVVDKNDKVTYKELVGEVADQPDFDKAIAAAKAAV